MILSNIYFDRYLSDNLDDFLNPDEEEGEDNIAINMPGEVHFCDTQKNCIICNKNIEECNSIHEDL